MTRKETLEELADRLRFFGFKVEAPPHLPALICDKCPNEAAWALAWHDVVVSLYCRDHAKERPHFPEGRWGYAWKNLSQVYDQAQADLLRLLDDRVFIDYAALQQAINVLPNHHPERDEMLPLDYRLHTIEWGLARGWIRPIGSDFGPVVAVPKRELATLA